MSASTLPVVAVAKADFAILSRSVILTAEFKPFQDVEVMAKVAGYVKKIYVDVGDRVAQGQLLATLEVPEMADDLEKAGAVTDRSHSEVARARDEVTRTESAHQMTHLSFTRLSAVMKTRPGLVAQQEIDDALSRDLVAEAQVAAAKSTLAAAEQMLRMSQADQARTRTMISYTRVTAPFAGVITKRFADTGAMIQAGTASQTQAMPVVRIIQSNLLRLILPVPESVVPQIRIGQSLEVRVPSLKRTLAGKVARFADEVDRSTRTMLTEVDVPNPGDALVPGMYAEVKLDLDRRQSVLSVPLAAIDAGEHAAKVYVVPPSGVLELRDVQVGMETPDRAEIRSGVKRGELVVIGSRSGLMPGKSVAPKLVQSAVAGDLL